MDERKRLRERLQGHNLTFVWLINVLNSKGVNVDKSEMSSAVNGAISGKKADTIIEKSHAVLDQYESFIGSVVV